ncbi:cation diffusion facilitator family transporter [Shimazuella sp. AN120528]|uniref:cation diffusion facilitator family transporter n=1 Tax=Shimazuella soli TaxID=1892854 RepID=UPI001F0F87E1|nr:cation diffusion facilitator family transporter [Shimazuella soli]MCH5585615.1 cation diffusion facilitator family transporter [Shimazuella soli]
MKLAWKSSIFAIWVSLISNVLLTIVKFIVGLYTRSQVLIADALHNAGDVIATVATLTSSMVSKKPADEDHPYGHGKAEVIASFIVAIILAVAAFYMVYHSIVALFEPAVKASLIALVAAFVSFVWKQSLYLYCIQLGKSSNSKSLIATAKDHLADVYASLAAIVGIGAGLLGDAFSIQFLKFGDPIAGIIVSYFVLKLAYGMAKESIGILMEQNVPMKELSQFHHIVEAIPEVKRIDRIRARDHGHYIIVDIRVSVPNQLTVKEGHDVSRRIKESIIKENPDVEEVLIHLNPWFPDNKP